VHAGEQNMCELGRKGGLVSPQTRLRKAADDDLREQAREVLAAALRGENVDREQLAAARSLFSYRVDAPPAGANEAMRSTTTAGIVTLGDVIQVALNCGMLAGRADGGVEVSGRVLRRAQAPAPPVGKN